MSSVKLPAIQCIGFTQLFDVVLVCLCVYFWITWEVELQLLSEEHQENKVEYKDSTYLIEFFNLI